MNTALIYQHIGEFVVGFQWLENCIREIGWLILDPRRTLWPPESLRTESNKQLVDRVTILVFELLDTLEIDGGSDRRREFECLANRCHDLRRKRNNLLHSAFIELKAGGAVQGILRTNPRLKRDEVTEDVIFDQDILTEPGLAQVMAELSEVSVAVSAHYTQLLHWAPFDHLRRR